MRPLIERSDGEYVIRHDNFELVEVYLGETKVRESWGGIAADLIHGRISAQEYLDWYIEQDNEIRMRNRL